MPLPLLAIPAGLAVAAAAGSGTSVATILGSIFGGAAVGSAVTGGVTFGIHKFLSDKDKKALGKEIETRVKTETEKNAAELAQAEEAKNKQQKEQLAQMQLDSFKKETRIELNSLDSRVTILEKDKGLQDKPKTDMPKEVSLGSNLSEIDSFKMEYDDKAKCITNRVRKLESGKSKKNGLSVPPINLVNDLEKNNSPLQSDASHEITPLTQHGLFSNSANQTNFSTATSKEVAKFRI